MTVNSRQLSNPPKYYVAVGASAGGLEAILAFFSSLKPGNKAAYIVIQHLAPDFKSVMEDLVQKSTSLTVITATDGCQVEQDCIYLIPPGKNMMIGEGVLLLSDQYPSRGPNFPIDIFFRSLAEDKQHHSVAIVLSGTGSDGSRGILATKEVGGLVLVQDVETAKFDGMPFNAFQTGAADFVGNPQELAEKLISYINHPMIANTGEPNLVVQDRAILGEIYKLLSDEYEIDFSLYKPQTVSRRIERRMGINQVNDPKDYLRLLISSPQELLALSRDMLIGVTRFFRDEAAFDEIQNSVLPQLINQLEPGESLRLWSAGCSTGEEAISMAILIDEFMHEHNRNFDVKIFATDVDPETITVASQTRFKPNIVEDIGEDRFARYFIEDGDAYTLLPRIRKMIIFAVHNLMSDPPFSNVHLVSCRNVLIYFQNEAQKKVLQMLLFALKLKGILFLGPSEVNSSIADQMTPINEKLRIYQKSSVKREFIATPTMRPIQREDRRTMPNIEHVLKNYEQNNVGVYNALLEQLLEEFLPPSVLADNDGNVIHLYGDIKRFTLPPAKGKVSNNILDMLVGALTIPVSIALKQAKEDGEVITQKGIAYSNGDGEVFHCDLRVKALRNSPLGPLYYYISVIPDDMQGEVLTPVKEKVLNYSAEEGARQRIRDLEQDLKVSQAQLQQSIEELETTNEELQSSNEELLAANEELQSTNEELQSVNEELYTVNSEYQIKIEEVTRANSDLDMLISAVQTGIVFLDSKLIIRKFSPMAANYFNLLPADIGRPIHHIAHKMDYPLLLNDLANVTSKQEYVEREIESIDGKSRILVRINSSTPVSRTTLNKETHCILTLTDISGVAGHKAEKEANE